MVATNVTGRRRSFGGILRRLFLLDLFKGLAVTFKYNVRALYEKRDGGNPNQAQLRFGASAWGREPNGREGPATGMPIWGYGGGGV